MRSTPVDTSLPREIALAFAPLHKRAFGMALGLACALAMAFVTTMPLIRTQPQIDLTLLNEYFYGYTMSWAGVLVATLWAGFVGFVMGWFVAFCRNFVLAVSAFIIKTRAELVQSADFLDHI